MICNFPLPYPDEILYSICARYSDRMQYPYPQAVARELFGNERKAKINLPNCLGNLVANLPSKFHCTLTNLIDDHTLLPLYEPFLQANKSGLIRRTMEEDGHNTTPRQLGLRNRVEYLRLCLDCAENDRKLFGESYWHRVHQIPGLEICPFHDIELHYCNFPVFGLVHKREYISIERILKGKLYRPTGRERNHDSRFLKIALDALWLLQNHNLGVNLELVQKRYHFLLVERGLSTPNGKINSKELKYLFQRYYSSDFLKQLSCELTESAYNDWTVRLPSRPLRGAHPIRHILFIHFLGYTLETFFHLPAEYKPFGSGPWPCLNPICEYYQEKHIRQCEINYMPHKGGLPRGVFSCECGFIYARTGPDSSEADAFRAWNVKVYGSKWEEKLRELWENPAISIKQAAHILGVAKATVRRRAQSLGFLRPQAISQSTSSQIIQRKHRTMGPLDATLREQYRALWLSSQEKGSSDNAEQFQNDLMKVRNWLSRHDGRWLKSHSQLTKKGQPKKSPFKSLVDWAKRDEQIAAEVRSSALRLKNLPGRPIWITTNSIIHDIDHGYTTIYQDLARLPLTAQALAEHIETAEEFALRRVQWIADSYRHEHRCPARGHFVRRCDIRPAEARWKSVKIAIDEALFSLEKEASVQR